MLVGQPNQGPKLTFKKGLIAKRGKITGFQAPHQHGQKLLTHQMPQHHFDWSPGGRVRLP